jgi:RNA polymerase sigma-70 factor (ECF subfamily)
MPPDSHENFAALVEDLRPRLHRYCARMVGSALDGEDVVQDALAKAALHYDPVLVREPKAWMFRVAHNAALDFLRRRSLERRLFSEAEGADEMGSQEAVDPYAAAEATAAALATFMHLPFAQRSAVILADVLGHALQEIAQTLETTVPAVKAALHRGRTRLRELGRLGELPPKPALSPQLVALAQQYAQRFNARDFDGLRALLADEVRLQVAGRVDLKGRAEVSGYFGNYARLNGLRSEAAAIEGHAGLWVHEGSTPAYVIVLEWDERGKLAAIRDFRYARYVGDALRGA